MARTDTGAALTDQHRKAQGQVNAAALRDFLALWPIWQGDDDSFGTLVVATLVLVRAYHRLSSLLAASYFDAFRAAEDPGGSAVAVLAPPVDVANTVAGLQLTGRVMTRKALAGGVAPQRARETAFVRTSGAVTSHVLKGGRDTLIQSVGADPRALKWARVTSGTPCAFCAMVASRGAVFKGESTAEFEPHDHCNCTVEPHYEGSAMPPDSKRWRDLYNRAQRDARATGELDRGTSNDALNAFRRSLAAQSSGQPAG